MSCLYLDSCTSVMPLRWEIMQNNHSQSTWDIRMTSVWYLQGVAAGVLRGVGKQLIGALCNFVAFYFIGFPIGVSLMFAANMGIVGKTKLCVCVCVTLSQRICLAAFRNFFFFFFWSVTGLWTGLVICLLLQMIFYVTFLCKLDWKKASEDVSSYISCFKFKAFLFEAKMYNQCLWCLWSGSCESRGSHHKGKCNSWAGTLR